MSRVLDPELYELAKAIVYPQYSKPSAYRSGALVKKYKELGGRYGVDAKTNTDVIRSLERWFLEQWADVNPSKTKTSYPVYRPTVRVNKDTPKTAQEISPNRLREQATLKQILKGSSNLPPF